MCKKLDYTKTQPYRLGLKCKKIGELLMDEKTDIRDLMALADSLGCDIDIELVDRPDEKPATER